MTRWAVLASCVALEVIATLASRGALDQPWWAVLAVLGHGAAFVGLAVLLHLGAPTGVVYSVWATAGIGLTAVIASSLFAEQLTAPVGIGIAAVIAGVVLVHTGRAEPEAREPVR